MKIELYKEIRSYLKELIKGTEFESNVFCVGGCCRDELLGLEIKDIDLAVTIQQGGIKLADWLYANGYLEHEPVTYPTYTTAQFVLKKYSEYELEAVQTRKEKYDDPTSRNPITVFGTIEDDCMRRDLTINALFYDISNEKMLDICGYSLDDIKNQIIRTPTDPDIIYDDDPLRILRCIRFATRFGWKIEDYVYDSMKRNAYRLEIISKERVRDEFTKMMTCKHPNTAIEMLLEINAMQYVLPGLDFYEHIYMGGTKFEKRPDYNPYWMEKLVPHTDHLLVRLVPLLMHKWVELDDSPLKVEESLKTLKYPNKTIVDFKFYMKTFVEWNTLFYTMNDENDKDVLYCIRKLQHICGYKERYDNILLLFRLFYESSTTHMCVHKRMVERMTELSDNVDFYKIQLPINGNTLMDVYSIERGEKIRKYLDATWEYAFYTNPSYDEIRSFLNIFKKSVEDHDNTFPDDMFGWLRNNVK